MFENYKKATFDEIYDYVSKEKPEYLDKLKKDVEADRSFLTIKKEFYQEYFPQYIPTKKPKAPSMKEKLGIKKK